MNAQDCVGFEEVCDFLSAVEHWREFSGAATYLVVCNKPIGRLEGVSDIIYIGKSERFGGDSSSRLWTYCHPTKGSQEERVMHVVGDLTTRRERVSLHICQQPPDGQTVKQYETHLLGRYKIDHWELPPCNFQRS